MSATITVLAIVCIMLCILLGDLVYSRGYAKGWDDSVIREYEKEFE